MRQLSTGTACIGVLLLAACSGVDAPAPGPADEWPTFSRVQPELYSAPGAQPNAWADFDGDGDLDLFVGFRGAPDRLYRNDGGVMVDVAADYGVDALEETRAAAWGDYDLDGDLDLYVGFADAPGLYDRIYQNRGVGRPFVDVSEALGVRVTGTTRQPSWIDYDGDGDVDLSVALRNGPNRLYRNDPTGFVEVGADLGVADPGRTVSTAWFDMDGDGDLDVFTANQNGDDDSFFRNDGDRFVDVAPELGMNQPGRAETAGSVGAAIADYDNDGDLDLYVASYGPDFLWRNEGGGRFVNAAAGAMATDHHSVAAAWADVDHDGFSDLYVTVFVSGEPEAEDQLVRNVAGVFSDALPGPMADRGASHGVAWADFDRDGDLDVALANNAPEVGTHHLYRNDLVASAAARSLQIVVLDEQGRWSRAGAEVRLRNSASGELLGTRLVDTGGGYSSQGAAPVHFGLARGVGLVDVEVTLMVAGRRTVIVREGVDPADYLGGWLEIRG